MFDIDPNFNTFAYSSKIAAALEAILPYVCEAAILCTFVSSAVPTLTQYRQFLEVIDVQKTNGLTCISALFVHHGPQDLLYWVTCDQGVEMD